MLKPNQIIRTKWNGRNKKYYIEKGYVFTYMGNEFDVKVEDLLPSSKSLVVVCCDYCGKETIKKFQTYKNQHDVLLGDCCKKC